ncbi:MAG: AMP-binding protein [Deltaproteobacteria bacterium]|nr:AMP-binding protein [Deltaproteobacteria bacterium]
MADSGIPLIEAAEKHRGRTAIATTDGTFTYDRLLESSKRTACGLLAGQKDLEGRRVAFLTPRSFDYPAIQWGIWRAGGIAVPLCEVHPPAELKHTLSDSGASIVVSHPDFSEILAPIAKDLNVRFLLTDQLLKADCRTLPMVDSERPAMILYTSGTTGKPKGVVLTHHNLEAQITTLIKAWEWRREDRILHVLPLHHTHGIVNVLCCALWAGAVCDMLPRFDALGVWQKFVDGNITLFMAVPTIYFKLMEIWEKSSSEQQQVMGRACDRLRLMVSGSAALPVTAFHRWKSITGHALLERYGMTEIGMALSNPLHEKRRPGHVGTPLPGVEIRLADQKGHTVPEGTSGEIEVRGPTVFQEYWRRPIETESAFRGSWFKTGDVAVVEENSYRIRGRQSTDIIKTGGYKVSALEIEEVLRRHPNISECAVVGMEDPEWGERVCAAILLKEGSALSQAELRKWGKERLAPYKVPSNIMLVKSLPRNPMGKVTKPDVKDLFESL